MQTLHGASKGRHSASRAVPSPAEPFNATTGQRGLSKPGGHPRREKTPQGGRMSPTHSIPVIGLNGEPLTPTTPTRARKLVRGGQAVPSWTKLDTYAIRMIVPTRKATPRCALGVDHGHAHEGYAVVCGEENVLALKVDLPDKSKIVRKLDERRRLRRSRRSRTCRRRAKRFDNRRRKAHWIA